MVGGQKAPRTRRCIKTPLAPLPARRNHSVRKHPAPEGALRPESSNFLLAINTVRKHPAPEGALKRQAYDLILPWLAPVRKHPASEDLLKERTVHLHLLNELGGRMARRGKRS